MSDTTTAPAPVIAPVETPVDTPTEQAVPIDTDGGDHDRFAHYARKDDVARAYVTGEAITALCGKKWVPSRDPDPLPDLPDVRGAQGRGLEAVARHMAIDQRASCPTGAAPPSEAGCTAAT